MEVKFKKLEFEDMTKENLNVISKLIYQTDPYIYPALFANEENAVSLLTAIIPLDVDEMFSWRNIYVAMMEKKVVALILWKKGYMRWDKNFFLQLAKKQGVELPETFSLVYEKYFATYEDKQLEGVTSLINVCVDKKVRLNGIAKNMLNSFLHIDQKGQKYELFCLQDNEIAMKLYVNRGFRKIKRQKAFTVDDKNIYSVQMVL